MSFIGGVFFGVLGTGIAWLLSSLRSYGTSEIYDAPCGACGMWLHGEGLPSVNWRNGAAYCYCPDCGTEQHRDATSVAPRSCR